MTEKRRTYRGGSTAIFVIVTIVLALALSGAIYYSRYRSEIARKEKAIAAYNEKVSQSENEQPSNQEDESKEPVRIEVEENESESSSAELLPQGGVADIAGNMLAVFMLSSSVAIFISSVRSLRTSTL